MTYLSALADGLICRTFSIVLGEALRLLFGRTHRREPSGFLMSLLVSVAPC